MSVSTPGLCYRWLASRDFSNAMVLSCSCLGLPQLLDQDFPEPVHQDLLFTRPPTDTFEPLPIVLYKQKMVPRVQLPISLPIPGWRIGVLVWGHR